MKRFFAIFATTAASILVLAPSAWATFGMHGLDLTFTGPGGEPSMQAGSHPFAWTTDLAVDTTEKEVEGKFFEVPVEDLKDITFNFPPGLIADPTAVPRCSAADFAAGEESTCPPSSAVGVFDFVFGFGEPTQVHAPVYNLAPPPGKAIRIGFRALGVPITVDGGINTHPPYDAFAASINTPQGGFFYRGALTVWGDPADPVHDAQRGECAGSDKADLCPTTAAETPFVTMPRSCTGPLPTHVEASSWPHPFPPLTYDFVSHDNSEPPQPLGAIGCSKLGFSPSISAQPTTKAATSPTGLDFGLDVSDPGLANPEGVANADIRKAVVTLPEGMSVNPSQAEGLAVCSEADLQAETLSAEPGQGCPQASKIGTVEVESPLIEEVVKGSLYIAKPYENEFNSLLALYIVLKNQNLGILVKQGARVEPNPVTGQLVTTTEDMPQLPFSHFRLHFREGVRSPLASPPACGSYDAAAELTPWSGGAPITTTSVFQIISGSDNSPCPAAGVPPLHPGLQAGTINNAAGHYSPFNVRLFRSDSEQELTHFSIKLPPGVVGKLAGIPFCPDAAIAAAKARTGPHGGAEELAAPSCPAASEVGRTLVGAGVGPALTYVPGKLYLAGPYHGSALSIVSITSGVAGPFDLGTVVVREALKVNPETAEVFVDATGSDPIPHIIQGIPVHLRDIRIYVDRPDFVLNPTNCEPTSTASTVLGAGLDFASEADDRPVTVTTRFQAADCASLGFAPKLALSLKGGTKRNAVPAFKAVLTYPKGSYANIKSAQVTLPKSVFLDNAHIGTICTRPVFNEGAVPGEKCPAASVYGHARAITPLLDEPIEGPVFLRANGGERNLPDLVVALHSGKININLAGYIDSVHKKGSESSRIRNTFALVPDAPVTKFTLDMAGGKKGLLINSTNLCKSTNKALAAFTGQNGKKHDFEPVLKPTGCAKKGGKSKRLALVADLGW